MPPSLSRTVLLRMGLGIAIAASACSPTGSGSPESPEEDSGPIISQRSTGGFAPYAPRERTWTSASYAPGSNTYAALWKMRLTLPDRSLDHPATLSLELIQGAGISETSEMEIIAPTIRFRLTDDSGKIIEREKLRRDIVVESIVDRFVDASNTTALLLIPVAEDQEERWLIESKYISVQIAEDASRSVKFFLRETDATITLAAIRPKRTPSGWKKLIPPPTDVSELKSSTTDVTDSPSQLGIEWTPPGRPFSHYRLATSYAPFSGPGCEGGRDIYPSEVSSTVNSLSDTKIDRIRLFDLIDGQKIYVQLCSANERKPPDFSEGVVKSFNLPKRAKALLKDAPQSDTNVSSLEIRVTGEDLTSYRYDLIFGASDCETANYGPWTSITVPIRGQLQEGAYALCVLGKISDTNIQRTPSLHLLRVDRTAPAPFTLPPINQIITARKPEIGWNQVSGADSYLITVATDALCSLKVFTIESATPNLAQMSIADGSYYLCVTSKDAAGNIRAASNNGVPFVIDATPPGTFSILKPSASSTVYVHTPQVEWSPSQGSAFYSYSIGSSSTCSNPIISVEHLYSLSSTVPHLAAGTYYLCVSAKDSAGNSTNALNSGMAFRVSTGTWRALPEPGTHLSSRSKAVGVWASSYGQLVIWGGQDGNIPLGDGARFDLQSNQWLPITANNAPIARFEATAVWDPIRMRMVIWGGQGPNALLLSDGSYYEPGGPWLPIETSGAPWPRKKHTASLAGDSMVVWGGQTCGGPSSCDQPFLTNSGGILHIPTNSWQHNGIDTTDIDTPTAREFHTSVWTGSQMIVWGGYDGTSLLNSGGQFYLDSQDPWREVSTTNAPSPRRNHTAVWTGTKMLVWGGFGCLDEPHCNQTGYLNDGGIYDPLQNTWDTIEGSGSLSARSHFVSVWDGTGQRLFIWGGYDGSQYFNDGGIVTGTPSWVVPQVNPVGSPTGRSESIGVWTGNEVILFGGSRQSNLSDGAIFTPP